MKCTVVLARTENFRARAGMAIRSKLGRYSKLPAPQSMVHDLAGLAGNENVSFHQVAQVVGQDPGIAASLIRLANSAFFSNPTPVTELLSAIRVIGLDLSMAASMGAALSNQIGTLGATRSAYRQAWYEGLLRAHIARRIAQTVCPRLSGQAYLVGLFLEAGRLGLLASVRNYDVMLSAWAQIPERLLEVEVETFGVTHEDVRARIFERWELPSLLASALTDTSKPPETVATSDEHRLAQIAYVLRSASISKARGTSVVNPAIGEFLQSAFSLENGGFDEILNDAAREVSAMRRMFGTTIPRGARIVSDLAQLRDELLECHESRRWLRGASLLIVSDDGEQVEAMRRILSELGARTNNAASSRSDAVEMAKKIGATMIFLQRAEVCASKASDSGSCKSAPLRAPISVHCTHRELGMALAGSVDVAKLGCLDEASLWRRIHTLRLHRYRQPSSLL